MRHHHPDEARVAEFGLKQMWRSPNGTIRNILGGVVFREPIICSNVPASCRAGPSPSSSAVTPHGDQYKATDFRVPGPGTVTISYTPDDGGEPMEFDVAKFPGGGIAMGMYNFDDSIRDFARASLRYGSSATTRSTCRPRTRSSRPTTAGSRICSRRCSTPSSRPTSTPRASPTSTGSSTTWSPRPSSGRGGYVWACKNYDGDVQSDIVAQGFGSLGLMTSVLLTPDGKTCEAEAAHGTVTRHFRLHQKGEATSTNPIASIFAWTRTCAGRSSTARPRWRSSRPHSRTCACRPSSGQMTKDLALLVEGDTWLTTEEFLDALDTNLGKAMAGWATRRRWTCAAGADQAGDHRHQGGHEHQVEGDLDYHQGLGELAGGVDVAEADRGQGRQREVQRVGLGLERLELAASPCSRAK